MTISNLKILILEDDADSARRLIDSLNHIECNLYHGDLSQLSLTNLPAHLPNLVLINEHYKNDDAYASFKWQLAKLKTQSMEYSFKNTPDGNGEETLAISLGSGVETVPLQELPGLIERAVVDAQYGLSQAIDGYQKLFEHTSDPIILFNGQGTVVDCNPSMCKFLGSPEYELMGRNIQEILATKDPQIEPSDWVSSLQQESQLLKGLLKHHSGGQIPVEISASKMDSGIFQAIIKDTLENVSMEKLALANEGQLRAILDITQFAARDTRDLLQYALKKAISLTSSVFGALYLYDNRHHLFQLNSWTPTSSDFNLPIDTQGPLGEAATLCKPVIHNHYPADTLIIPQQPESLTSTLSVPIMDGDQLKGAIFTANKTTDYDQTDILQISILMNSVWKMIDQRYMQEELIESEEKYHLLFEHLTAGTILLKIVSDNLKSPPKMIIQSINPAFASMFGQETLGFIGDNSSRVNIFTDPDMHKRLLMVGFSETADEFDTFERSTSRHFHIIAYSPKLNQVAVVFQEITHRKKEEEELKYSRYSLNKAQSVAHVGNWVWDMKTNQIYWSEEMYNIFGIDKESFTGRLEDVINQRIHPDDRIKVEQSNQSAAISKTPIPLEYRIVLPDGAIKYVWAEAGELALDEAGQASELTGIVQDISERKAAEEALRKQSKEISILFSASQQFNQSLDPKTLYSILHQSLSSLMDVKTMILSQYDADSKLISCIFVNHENQIMDIANIPPLPLEPPGKGIQSNVIRTRKPELINDYQLRLANTQSNKYISNDGEVRENENLPDNPEVTQSAIVVPLLLKNSVYGVLQVQSYQLNAYTEEHLKQMEAIASLFTIANNNATLFQQSRNEITERKRIDASRQEVEEKFSKAFHTSPDAICIKSLKDGRYLEINDGFTRVSGFAAREVIGNTSVDLQIWVNEEERKRFVELLHANGAVLDFETQFRKKDGNTFIGVVSATILEINGEFCVLDITRDISEMKKVVSQLNDQLSELRRWSDVTLGRETRVLELKAEVNELLARLGEPQKYSSVS